jgi:hypothetical protein
MSLNNSLRSINLSFRGLTLSNGTSYTQSENCLGFNKLNIGIETNRDIDLYIQFTHNHNSGYTNYYHFSITGGNHFHTSINIRGSEVRYKFVNNDTEGKIDASSIFHFYGGGDSLLTKNLIKKNYNASLSRLVSNLDIDTIKGDIEGLEVKDLNSYVSGLTTTNKRNMWESTENNDLVLSSNHDLYIRCLSNNDDSGGTGARSIKIYGIRNDGGNLKEFEDTILTDGTLRNQGNISGLAVNKMEVLTSGVNATNENIIFIEYDSGGGVYKPLNLIPVEAGVSKTFFYCPPYNKDLVINEFSLGGYGQIVSFLSLEKVNISTGTKQKLFLESVDMSHYIKKDCSIHIKGGEEYLIGKINSNVTPPNNDNYFHLTSKLYLKDNQNQY